MKDAQIPLVLVLNKVQNKVMVEAQCDLFLKKNFYKDLCDCLKCSWKQYRLSKYFLKQNSDSINLEGEQEEIKIEINYEMQDTESEKQETEDEKPKKKSNKKTKIKKSTKLKTSDRLKRKRPREQE